MFRKTEDQNGYEETQAGRDCHVGDGLTPVSVALTRLATSLGQSFETGRLALALPAPPDALTLAGLGA
jgi:CRISPR-associated protein Cas1